MAHQPDVAPVCFCCPGAQRRRPSRSGPFRVEAGRHAWDAVSTPWRVGLFAAFQQAAGHKSLDRSFTAPWHGPRPSWVLPAVLGELLRDHPDAHVQPPRSVLNKKERTCACGPLAVEISARDHPRHPSIQLLGYISYLFPGRIWFQTSAASGAQRQRPRIVAFMGYLQRSPPLSKGNRYRLPAWSWPALSEYPDRMASAAVPKECPIPGSMPRILQRESDFVTTGCRIPAS